mgnify:CR=1 FL=1
MSKLDDARKILLALQVPKAQRNDMCCYTLIVMAGLQEESSWKQATNAFMRIHDILTRIKEDYNYSYAENTRETVRKDAVKPFIQAAFVENYAPATNSPKYSYRLTEEMLELVQSFDSELWNVKLKQFKDKHESLISQYASKRKMTMIPVEINGKELRFSQGKHNELQKAIIEEFAPRFAQKCECLYVGDTAEKSLLKEENVLHTLGFEITQHDTMPDVVLYSKEKNWLYFIEAVTSVGPMSPKRIIELESLTENVAAGKIYVTAFLDFKTYKKFSESLAWETEVWIAEMPDHMIHLNGDKFMGPRKL